MHDESLHDRRLPVYLVLDTSSSMSGEPIEAVRSGVKYLVSELKGDPHAVETVWLSVITFDSIARQVVPLTELMQFQEPQLDANGATALGEALRVLQDAFDREVRKGTADRKGDWKPLVFLMTDGEPTDSWEHEADALKQRRPGNIIACGAGSSVRVETLKRISEIVVVLNDYQPDTFKSFFKWMTASISTTSVKVSTDPNAPVVLPAAEPQHITIIP